MSEQCFGPLTIPTEHQEDGLREELSKELDDLTYDGLENLTGFICHKLKKLNPDTCVSKTTDNEYSWVNHLSEGGLSKPSHDLMDQTAKLEQIFDRVNKETLHISKNYMANLLEQCKNVECSNEVKKLFLRSRMYFRIRRLNQAIQEKSRKRKMLKIIN